MIDEFLKTTEFANFNIALLCGDASFRKYYRLSRGDESAIFMDSSLELNSLRAFLNVHKKLQDVHVGVSEIYAVDEQLGFMICEDFGELHYLDLLNSTNFMALYKKAIDVIVAMQKADVSALPLYDRAFLHKEMDLMQEWYIEGLLNHKLTPKESRIIKNSLEVIANVVLEQPQGYFVHRDFHSRNILQKSDGSLGIIDFQDAMSGALLYDLVSLLKDCYICFDEQSIKELVLYFKELVGLDVSDEVVFKWFDFMGLQRHIKVLGVFSRLYLRDAKSGYLADIPLTLEYAIKNAKKYEQTKELATFLENITK